MRESVGLLQRLRQSRIQITTGFWHAIKLGWPSVAGILSSRHKPYS